ncbi:MAG: hypothetical protein ACE5G1_17920 [bacterium]
MAEIHIARVTFLAIFMDILAWFLTKWDPVYAYTVVIAGAIPRFVISQPDFQRFVSAMVYAAFRRLFKNC